jgi:hypothetical protein
VLVKWEWSTSPIPVHADHWKPPVMFWSAEERSGVCPSGCQPTGAVVSSQYCAPCIEVHIAECGLLTMFAEIGRDGRKEWVDGEGLYAVEAGTPMGEEIIKWRWIERAA